jgi:hypothetical protein
LCGLDYFVATKYVVSTIAFAHLDSCLGVNAVSFPVYVELIVIPLTRVNLPVFESCYKITTSVVLTPIMQGVSIENTEAWLL